MSTGQNSSISPTKPLSEKGPTVRRLDELLFEVTISRQNRINLFSEAIERLTKNRDEAEVTLQNLRAWSPELAKAFKIRDPETVLNTSFRLICESDLGYVPFDSENVIRQFLAVSYCWRHDDQDWPADHSRPYEPWPFSQPFVEAVLAERGVHSDSPERNEHFRREGIWIDQMCIRQNDETEKQQSIAMMDMIYDRCRKLMILLEDVTFNPDEIRVIEKYNNPKPKDIDDATWKPDGVDIPHIASLCAKVENSRWWSRSWCWHEFEVNRPWSDMRHHYYAHNAVFIVKNGSPSSNGLATYSLKYLTLQAAQNASTNYANNTLKEFSIHKTLRWSIGENKTSPYYDPPQRGRGSERSSLMARYFVVSDTQCTIASDVISIIINLGGLAIYLVPQFKEQHEVFFVASILALACGERRPLTWMHNTNVKDVSTLGDEKSRGNDTSWLSRPLGGLDTALPKFNVGSVKGVHKVTQQHIELDLLFFEAPIDAIANEDIAATHGVFPETPIRSRVIKFRDMRFSEDTFAKNDDENYDKPRRRFLVAACKDGLAGIRRLWALLDKEVVQPSFNNVRFEPFVGDEALRPRARKLLSDLSRPADVSTHVPPQQDSDDEDVLLSLLTFVTDSRALYLITPLPASIQCNNGHAIIGPPVLRSPSYHRVQDRCRLAIPTDLINYPSNVSRVWLLLPLEEWENMGGGKNDARQNDAELIKSRNSRWKLVGKSLLLGEPRPFLPAHNDTDAENRLLTSRERQLVYG
ncbi:hypothetical protein AB5N19_03699 [Seiridium cardinale]